MKTIESKLLQISSVGKLERACYHLFRWKSCIWIKCVGIKTSISKTNSIKFHWDPQKNNKIKYKIKRRLLYNAKHCFGGSWEYGPEFEPELSHLLAGKFSLWASICSPIR